MASHSKLASVDPVSASRLHPNEARKIRRALEVYCRTGVPYSTWLESQKAANGCVLGIKYWLGIGVETARITALVTPGTYFQATQDALPTCADRLGRL
jgi:hypothetical protein